MSQNEGWPEWFPVVYDGCSLAQSSCSVLVKSHARVVDNCRLALLKNRIAFALRPFLRVCKSGGKKVG